MKESSISAYCTQFSNDNATLYNLLFPPPTHIVIELDMPSACATCSWFVLCTYIHTAASASVPNDVRIQF